MFKSLLVPLTGEESDISALEAAYAAARPFAGHIESLLVRPDAAQFAMRATATELGSGFMTPQLISAFEEQDKRTAAAARAAFDNFCKKHDVEIVKAPPGSARVSATSREMKGDTLERVTSAGRYYDLVVFGRAQFFSGLSTDGIGSVLLGCGRPVLIAPAKPNSDMTGTIAIAWKDTAEAARAVSLAIPLLHAARNIIILAAPENADARRTAESAEKLAHSLLWHKLDVRVQLVPAGDDAATKVVSAAAAAGANLLVMGGYGHSRLREFVFGGFTRRVLTDAPLPVLLAH